MTGPFPAPGGELSPGGEARDRVLRDSPQSYGRTQPQVRAQSRDQAQRNTDAHSRYQVHSRSAQTGRPPRGVSRRRGARGCLVSIIFAALFLGMVWAGAALMVHLTRWGGEAPAGPGEAVSEPVTPPLSFEGFNPGMIISDADLHNSSTMSEQDIQRFIERWNAGCVPGADGTPCLKDWRGSAPHFPEDDSCWEFAGGQDVSAAQVIYQAAQACEFNPQAILVILQKEQGLITASGRNLVPYRYASAMGFACPDDEPCDPEFEGFARQVYYGARQFQKYRIYPDKYQFQAGQTVMIPYHPDARCGGHQVTIENQATAGLYNYTPHQPNAEALAGVASECSSWGNLHFYAYWNAWFSGR